LTSVFLSSRFGHPPYLHSFPTRRSSDLHRWRDRSCDDPHRVSKSPRVAELPYPCSLPHRSLHGQRPYPFRGKGRVVSRTAGDPADRKSTRLNSSHVKISYAVFCLKKKKQ